jgi:hypothetical protein
MYATPVIPEVGYSPWAHGAQFPADERKTDHCLQFRGGIYPFMQENETDNSLLSSVIAPGAMLRFAEARRSLNLSAEEGVMGSEELPKVPRNFSSYLINTYFRVTRQHRKDAAGNLELLIL